MFPWQCKFEYPVEFDLHYPSLDHEIYFLSLFFYYFRLIVCFDIIAEYAYYANTRLEVHPSVH